MPLLPRFNRCKEFTCCAVVSVLVSVGCAEGVAYTRGGNTPPSPWYSVYLSWSSSSVPLVGRSNASEGAASPMPLLWWASDTQLWVYDPAGQMCYSTVNGSQWTATAVTAPPFLNDTHYSNAVFFNGTAWVVGSEGSIWRATPNCTEWNYAGAMSWIDSLQYWNDATLLTVGNSTLLHGIALGGGSIMYGNKRYMGCADTVYIQGSVTGMWYTGVMLTSCHLTVTSDADTLYVFKYPNSSYAYDVIFEEGGTTMGPTAANAGALHARVVRLPNANVPAPLLQDVTSTNVLLSATTAEESDLNNSIKYSTAVLQYGSLTQPFVDCPQPAPFSPRYDQQLVLLPWNGNVAFCGGFSQPQKLGAQYTDVWFG